MLDIIGIGSLNLDYTLTTEKLGALPTDVYKELLAKVESGAEKFAAAAAIKEIIALFGNDYFRITLGGSAFNTCMAMASLASGLRAGCIGAAGGRQRGLPDFISTMDAMGIDHKYVNLYEGKDSGLCLSLNHEGRRSFLFAPGSNNEMASYLKDNYEALSKYVSAARLVQVTQFADERIAVLLEQLLRDARIRNPLLRISCDPGYCWLENITPAVRNILRMSDYLFLNTIEFNRLIGRHDLNTDLAKAKAILTKGEENLTLIVKADTEIKIYRRKNKKIVEQIFPIDALRNEEIVDATGAGDVFAAGFLTIILMYGDEYVSQAVELGMVFMRAKLLLPPAKLYPTLAESYQNYKVKF
ncbi:MAG: carbohydrate kinase family protein [Acidaminococcaceae bacterium]